MTPDRDPDHAVTAPEPADDPRYRCKACGRSTVTHLSFAEMVCLYGYSRTDCVTCMLTDAPRPAGPA